MQPVHCQKADDDVADVCASSMEADVTHNHNHTNNNNNNNTNTNNNNNNNNKNNNNFIKAIDDDTNQEEEEEEEEVEHGDDTPADGSLHRCKATQPPPPPPLPVRHTHYHLPRRRYQLVDTWPAADAACARINACRLIAMDMEGAPLGGGPTSMLQIAVSPREIYIFDVHVLGQALFDAAHLLPMLADPRRIKLCFDGRGDGFALFACHGVSILGFYDLQVVFTSLFQDTARDPFLKGLHRAVERLAPAADARAFTIRKEAVKRHWRVHGCASVLDRPIATETLEYAASDVAYLFRMYALWGPYVAESAVLYASHKRVLRYIRRQDRRMLTTAHLDFDPIQQRC